MENTSVQLDPDMIANLNKIAKIEERTRSFIIRRAIQKYINACKKKGLIK